MDIMSIELTPTPWELQAKPFIVLGIILLPWDKSSGMNEQGEECLGSLQLVLRFEYS